MSKARVAVIGAGWAGLSAAVALLRLRHQPVIFESARQLGGRARRVEWDVGGDTPLALDNGQHILIGAYSSTLALMATLGIDTGKVLLRTPLHLESTSGLRLVAANLGAPWHLALALARARGLSVHARVRIAYLLGRARLTGWRLTHDLTVQDWLVQAHQPQQAIDELWAPLCVAALNTPFTIASAQVFLNVLRDSLGASRSASDLLLPIAPLDQLLPIPAAAHIEARGGVVRTGARVTSLARRGKTIELAIAGAAAETFDGVVLAVAGHHVPSLIEGQPWEALASPRAQCEAMTWQPITTIYLRYPEHTRLALPMQALKENTGQGDYGQWLFDKGQLGGPSGLLAVVISAQGPHQDLAHEDLARSVGLQLQRQLGVDGAPLSWRAISEKRATFACTTSLQRPEVRTTVNGLTLAGDYTQSDYPATLEGAVRSGEAAAQELASQLAQRER